MNDLLFEPKRRSEMDHIVVDVEIQNSIDGVNYTWNDTDKLGVSVAVVYEFLTDRFKIYGAKDVKALQERLLRADRISGFNTWGFDFPVIWRLRERNRVWELEKKSNDLLRRIWQAKGLDPDKFYPPTHGGYSLNSMVAGTLKLNLSKIGGGAEAPIWYQQNKWERLTEYCIDDVTLERDLARFVDEHGYLISQAKNELIRL